MGLARMKLPSPASRPMQSTTRSRRPSCRPTRSASCTAVSGQTAADDKWCVQNCGNVPPNCPAELSLARMKLPSPAARVAAEEKLRSIEQQSTKSGEMSVAEREEWQKARDREIASDPGPVDGIPAQFRAVAPV